MKAAQIQKYGGADVVEIRDTDKPQVADTSVLVQIYAAGVNPVDWKIREGYLQTVAPLQFPATLGGDFSGTILETGKQVTEFAAGDMVYGSALILGAGTGAFAEFARVNSSTIAKKPDHIDAKHAAALPLPGVSAVMVLTELMSVSKDQKILIHGGAGGIGSIAIQIAKHLGATVITTVSQKDVAYVKFLGADTVIVYSSEQFDKVLQEVDWVFDTVGGDTYTRSFAILKKGGMIVSMNEQPNAQLMKQYGVTALSQFTQINTARLNKLTQYVDSGVVNIQIDKEFPLTQAAQALLYQQTGHPAGKVIITVV